jgi:glycosyltransferase involved in cell wall biosynthesis
VFALLSEKDAIMIDSLQQRFPGKPNNKRKTTVSKGAGLHFRNALPEWDHVPSRIVVEGCDSTKPLVTIAITTFKRSALLIEAIHSALRQRFDKPYEIIVLDNDPASEGAPALMTAVPELSARAFRYFINGENFGVFGNFNRCIQVARGDWLTILNDDDMLDENYLDLMFREIDQRPIIDGIVCNKRYIDNIGGDYASSEASPLFKKMDWKTLLSHLRSFAGVLSLASRLRGRAMVERKFKFRSVRKILPRTFFWGAMLGNGGGFLFRRSKAIEVGGFYPEEYPSADFWFFARFSKVGDLRQHRATAASIRKTPGSITLNSVAKQIKLGYNLQRALVGTETPRWWGLLLPTVIAHARTYFILSWGVDIPVVELEKELNIRLPPDRLWLLKSAQFILGGEY